MCDNRNRQLVHCLNQISDPACATVVQCDVRGFYNPVSRSGDSDNNLGVLRPDSKRIPLLGLGYAVLSLPWKYHRASLAYQIVL